MSRMPPLHYQYECGHYIDKDTWLVIDLFSELY